MARAHPENAPALALSRSLQMRAAARAQRTRQRFPGERRELPRPGPAVRYWKVALESGGGKASSPDFFHLAACL